MIKTLADVTRIHAQHRGEKSALFYADDGREWTYSELDFQANIVANALLAAGVTAGDRVAYLDKNSPEYFNVPYIPIGLQGDSSFTSCESKFP